MLTLLTTPWKDQDYRLKILWIEDKIEKLPAPEVISQYFIVWRARRPDEIADKLKQELDYIGDQHGNAKMYDLPCLPFDGFLADFDLTGASKDAESRLITEAEADVMIDPTEGLDVTFKESGFASDPGEELRELAKDAEAAGLTAAILTALNFDDHPSVILPYTAFPEQLSRQRALIRLLAPLSIVISRISELDLGKEISEIKLQQFVEEYRNNLQVWASAGVISILSGERQRLQGIAQSRAYGSDQSLVKWTDHDFIVMDTIFGRRCISCKSLWYRFDDADPSLAEVNNWLATFPIPTTVYSEAVNLANLYWVYSETEESKYRYILSRLLRSLETEQSKASLEVARSQIKELCTRFKVDFQKAIESPTEVTMSFGEYVPNLLEYEKDRNVLRLAAFMLLTMEYAARYAALQDETDPLSKLRRIIRHKDNRLEEMKVPFSKIDIDNLIEEHLNITALMADLGYNAFSVEKGELLLERATVHDYDMAQRLDPIPKQLLTTEQKFSGERIYQALKRKLGIDIKAIINGQEKGEIEPDERRELQRFALDIDFPFSDWPEWLRKNYRM